MRPIAKCVATRANSYGVPVGQKTMSTTYLPDDWLYEIMNANTIYMQEALW
jgi:hypothetical protein